MTPTSEATRSRQRNERRELDRRVEHARTGFRMLAGLLLQQDTALLALREELDAIHRRHAAIMAVAAITMDDTGLVEVTA